MGGGGQRTSEVRVEVAAKDSHSQILTHTLSMCCIARERARERKREREGDKETGNGRE